MKYLKTIVLACMAVYLFSACKRELEMNLLQSILMEEMEINSIHAEEAFEIKVVYDERSFVEMECSAYLKEYIICKVENGCLTLSVNKASSLPHGTVYRAVVHTPTLQSIVLTEASNVTITGDFDGFSSVELSRASYCSGGVFTNDKVRIVLSDASQLVDFSFIGQQLEAQVTDASRFVGKLNATDCLDIRLASASSFVNYGGNTETATLNLEGSSLVNMAQTEIRDLEVVFSGASSATVKVSETVKGRLSGCSSLYYYGNPVFDPDFVCETASFVVRL